MRHNNIELSNRNYTLVDGDEKLTAKEIQQIVANYVSGPEIKRLQKYDDYYQSNNTAITARVQDKYDRDKTPNNWVPTAYYSTVVDAMSGYMFSNVEYNTQSNDFQEVLKDNNVAIKDMNNGVRALAYNKGIEIVYTVGDGLGPAEIKFSPVDPRQMILVFTRDIEPQLFCGIRVLASTVDDFEWSVDVIYADEWQQYNIKDDKAILIDVRDTYFSECPVVFYFADDMAFQSVFQKLIPYINALDFVITGNANDIDKLTDAILVLTKELKGEQKRHLDEIAVLTEIEVDERAEYLEKHMDPAFREYASKLLIQEIHKHAHVIDWYSPDSGLSGEISAKAMKTRLFDMQMYSERIEMVFRVGAEKRARLIDNMLTIQGKQTADDLEINFNRTLPDDFIDTLIALSNVSILSNMSKYELLNMDPEEEAKRLLEEKTANMELFDINDSETEPIITEDETE